MYRRIQTLRVRIEPPVTYSKRDISVSGYAARSFSDGTDDGFTETLIVDLVAHAQIV